MRSKPGSARPAIRAGSGRSPNSSISRRSSSSNICAPTATAPIIVTGGGQDFVRAYSERVYGVPAEQVIGTMFGLSFKPGADGKPVLVREAKLLLNDDEAGKPEGIHLVIGRRPQFAFGNSAGDREMLEYTKAGPGARLGMIVLHDDSAREYAYGPAQGLPDTKIGTFPQSLYDQAMKDGWIVVSMKNDWKRVFAFE